jgi:CHASE3 domain sensor protein
MDNTSSNLPPINESTKNYLEAVRELAQNLRDRTRLESETRIKQAESLLKDYGQYSLIALGSAITVETVGSQLIKSKALFFFGVTILIIAVVTSFVTRAQLHNKINDYRIKVEEHFDKVNTKVRSYLINPTAENMGALQEAAQFHERPISNWLTNNGTNLNALLFFIGFLSLSISLVFKISA